MTSGLGEPALVPNSLPISSFPSCQLGCELGHSNIGSEIYSILMVVLYGQNSGHVEQTGTGTLSYLDF